MAIQRHERMAVFHFDSALDGADLINGLCAKSLTLDVILPLEPFE